MKLFVFVLSVFTVLAVVLGQDLTTVGTKQDVTTVGTKQDLTTEGTKQTMEHLMVCPGCPNTCTREDLLKANQRGIDVAVHCGPQK
ncbi:unnamed protein product [Plutella xylostella]|uniref:(diamondback moth) hypothetical protein n=1 Tax=Plutella xylostella TaxID=51655 RepID=A0A8S4GBD1_PLUXY|nr:unnamed protein product [Plutella xylostella]